MKNFLKSFFLGEKSTEEQVLLSSIDQQKQRDVMIVAIYAEEEQLALPSIFRRRRRDFKSFSCGQLLLRLGILQMQVIARLFLRDFSFAYGKTVAQVPVVGQRFIQPCRQFRA